MDNNVNIVREPRQFRLQTTRSEPWHKLAVKGIAISILSVVVLAAPQGASAWQSFNGMEVNKVNDNVFEVFPKSMEQPNGTHYWCAAAAFAEAQLRAKSGDIYVVRGMGAAETAKRSTGAVQFTLDASAAGVTPGPMAGDENRFNAGEHMGITQAHENC